MITQTHDSTLPFEHVGDSENIKPRYIHENFTQAMERVPALSCFNEVLIYDFISTACNLVDCMEGYDFFQVVLIPYEPCIFIFKTKP